jgi:dTDP-4-amino-4,6-dideoxygalactose transaminase
VNSRLDELQAALLREKLPRLSGWIGERRRVAAVYDEVLKQGSGVVTPPLRDGADHARHLYPVQVEHRDEVMAALRERGVPTAIHYPTAAHDQGAFAESRERPLPVTERLCRTLLSLPIHPYVSDADARRIAELTAAAANHDRP